MDDIRDSGKRPKSVTLLNVHTTKNGMIYETLAGVMDSVTLSNIRVTKYGIICETLASTRNP